ncbi:MAG TPA: imidazole glycerol phosphate synthase subunit HisH [Gammaproteobacteria bacterium]|nr:imidazole glycerol phosphate synthase subunit HisH [Gammaproteobacteria bacterium]
MTVIVDYDAGNLRSVQRACTEVGLAAIISHDPEAIRHADRIIFPGVGAAGSAMRSIRKSGVDVALEHAFRSGVPILGICLGLQISLEFSEENDQKTLGFLPGKVCRFQLRNRDLKIPHMGWNEIEVQRRHPLLEGINDGDEFYFVHSFFPEPENPTTIFASAQHEREFCCAAGLDNFFGTQFHPEKSGRVGLELLDRFRNWDGRIAE